MKYVFILVYITFTLANYRYVFPPLEGGMESEAILKIIVAEA